jgi:large subunit ribosomal protein L25
MANVFTLESQRREGKAKTARKNGGIPGVLYGHGMKAENVTVDAKKFNKIFSQAGSTSLVTLTVEGGDKYPVLLRDVQFHPVKGHIMHVDYYRVRMDEALRAQVPLHFVGEAPAVKDMGGVLVRNMDEVELEALPQDLPHDIEVSIAGLDSFDKLIRVSDLKLPKGVKLMHEDTEVVALVQPPRTEEELASLAEEVKEDVEAVEGVKKEEVAAEGEEGSAEEAKKE